MLTTFAENTILSIAVNALICLYLSMTAKSWLN